MTSDKAKAQLRTFQQMKAERINRAETTILLRRIKIMEKDLGSHRVRILRDQREITSKMKEVRRTSGHSSLRLCPLDNDPQLKQSPYFTTKMPLSEKQLTRWRITEADMERRYKLGELKIRKQHQYEQALVKLLRDIGVIPEDANIFKPGSDEPAIRAPKTLSDEDLMEGDAETGEEVDENAPLWERFPRIFNSLLIQKQRPSTVADPLSRPKGSIKPPPTKDELAAIAIAEYISRLTTTSTYSHHDQPATHESLPGIKNEVHPLTHHPVAKPVRASSAPHISSSGAFTNSQASPGMSRAHLKGTLEPLTETIASVKQAEPSKIPLPNLKEAKLLSMVEKNLEDNGFERLPQWKRQLLFEAPPGTTSGSNKETIKVRLTSSRNQRRKVLDQMVSENKKDLESIAIEANERRIMSREVMSKALIGALKGKDGNCLAPAVITE